ncbi:MAG: hypothetical protein QXX38_02690 [Candidatus Aenigmatarchaeota archaeon]
MEVGKLLSYVLFLLVVIIALVVYFSFVGKFSIECKEALAGSKYLILENLKNCAELCWSKNDFGQGIFSEDCFLVKINSLQEMKREEMERFFEKYVKIYFDSIESNKNYQIKVRYNSTGKEISLLIFEAA